MLKQILFPQLYIFHHFTPNLPSPHYEKLLNFEFDGFIFRICILVKISSSLLN